jgi:hypothetical protein
VRNQPLVLTPNALEVLYSALQPAPPQIELTDLAENSTFAVTLVSDQPYAGSPLFRVAAYSASIYPGASYAVVTQNGGENPPLQRPFPADPSVPGAVSQFALGASAWLSGFPAVAPLPVSIQPHSTEAGTPSSFAAGVSVQVSVGNGPPYETVAAIQQADGTFQATPNLALDTTTAIDLIPAAGTEPTPYAWIDTSRYFTPSAGTPTLFTTEGVYGVTALRATQFADPANRTALMQAAFGAAVVGAGIFAAREMPYGSRPARRLRQPDPGRRGRRRRTGPRQLSYVPDARHILLVVRHSRRASASRRQISLPSK